MCGILFAINNDTYATNTDDFMKDAFLASQVRGTDSAGLMLLDKHGDTATRKMGVSASQFLDNRETDTMMKRIPSSRLAIGHVRAATSGWISSDNAHPFKATRLDGSYIIGVHNGTLTGWRAKKNAEKFSVDSDWLFHTLATEGHDAFEYFNGAFALVWYDSNHPDSVFMARNAERPLHYMITEDGKSMLGCSELGMLGWLTDRNRFKHHKEHPTAYYLLPGKIYKFDLNDIGKCTDVEYPKYDPSTTIVRPTTTTSMVPATQRHAHVSMYPRSNQDDWNDWGGAGYANSNYYYDDEDGEEIMQSVKKALRDARYSLVGNPNPATALDTSNNDEMVTQDDLEAAIMQAVLEHQETKTLEEAGESVPWVVPQLAPDEITKGEIFLTSVHGASVTEKEKANARLLGCYGRVVNFVGSWYDDENNTCMGTYTIHEDGKDNTYDAEIRFIKRNLAHDLYINRKEGESELCIIVGVHDTVEWMMCEPLTHDQRQFLEDEVLSKFSLAGQAVH